MSGRGCVEQLLGLSAYTNGVLMNTMLRRATQAGASKLCQEQAAHVIQQSDTILGVDIVGASLAALMRIPSQPRAEATTKPTPKPKPKSTPKLDRECESESESESEIETKTETKTETKAEAETKTETKSETKTKTETKTKAEPDGDGTAAAVVVKAVVVEVETITDGASSTDISVDTIASQIADLDAAADLFELRSLGDCWEGDADGYFVRRDTASVVDDSSMSMQRDINGQWPTP